MSRAWAGSRRQSSRRPACRPRRPRGAGPRRARPRAARGPRRAPRARRRRGERELIGEERELDRRRRALPGVKPQHGVVIFVPAHPCPASREHRRDQVVARLELGDVATVLTQPVHQDVHAPAAAPVGVGRQHARHRATRRGGETEMHGRRAASAEGDCVCSEQDCHLDCRFCHGRGNADCTQCHSARPFLQPDGSCGLECPLSYFADLSGRCLPCDSSCFACTGEGIDRGDAAGDHEGQIAYDLLPIDPERGYCHGPSCRQTETGSCARDLGMSRPASGHRQSWPMSTRPLHRPVASPWRPSRQASRCSAQTRRHGC